jgi:hypothetical protein
MPQAHRRALSSLGPSSYLIHPSAWKRNSANFAPEGCPCGIMTRSERGRLPRREEVVPREQL